MKITESELNDIRMAAFILDDPPKFQLQTLVLCAVNLRKLIARIEKEQATEAKLPQSKTELPNNAG